MNFMHRASSNSIIKLSKYLSLHLHWVSLKEECCFIQICIILWNINVLGINLRSGDTSNDLQQIYPLSTFEVMIFIWTKKKVIEYIVLLSCFPLAISLISLIFYALDWCLIDINYNVYSALKHVFSCPLVWSGLERQHGLRLWMWTWEPDFLVLNSSFAIY